MVGPDRTVDHLEDWSGQEMQRENRIPAHTWRFVTAPSRWISRFFFWLVNSFPAVRRSAYGALFDLIAAVTPKLTSITMMNYGFADLDDRASPIELEPSEEPERYSLQLYDRVAGAANLRGLDVLDVSCGRGGGALYILRHLGARHVTGLDFCKKAIGFCRRTHRERGLTFIHGDAEALPFADERFDVVVNIESSFCYSDMNRFLAEVRRVLKPSGLFAFADLRHGKEVNDLLKAFKESGFEILEKADITRNVTRALELDGTRRARGVRRFIPPALRPIFSTYTGAPDTRIPKLLEQRELVYLRLLLQTPSQDRMQA